MIAYVPYIVFQENDKTRKLFTPYVKYQGFGLLEIAMIKLDPFILNDQIALCDIGQYIDYPDKN